MAYMILFRSAMRRHNVTQSQVRALTNVTFNDAMFGGCAIKYNLTTPSTGSHQCRLVQTEAASGEKKAVPIKDFSQIPGPKPLPIIGNLSSFLLNKDFDPKKIEIFWKNLFDEYGPIVKLKIPLTPIMVASINPDDMEVMLKSTMNNPMRYGFETLKKIRYNAKDNYFDKKSGLLPENGDEWWRLRSRVQGPLLRPKNVAMYLPKVDTATLKFIDMIEEMKDETGKVPDNFLQQFYKWSLECVGLVALDREIGCLDPNLSEDSLPLTIIRLVDEMFVTLNETEMGLPTWKFYRTASYIKLETAHNAFLEIIDKLIQEQMKKLEDAGTDENSDHSLSVMEQFLKTDGLSKSDVATMVLDMLFAGVDTTSHTIGFTLYLLSKNPECQKKLQEEIDTVMDDSSKLLPTHISKMTYLHYVLKESLRIHPLTHGNGRVLTHDVVMSGYNVPAGTVGFGFNFMMSMDEKYFAQAKDFIPERWARDKPLGAIHPFVSLPFSHGTRMCVGKRVAEQEIFALLIRILQKYDVSFESDRKMEIVTQMVLKPAIPLSFTFKLRN